MAARISRLPPLRLARSSDPTRYIMCPGSFITSADRKRHSSVVPMHVDPQKQAFRSSPRQRGSGRICQRALAKYPSREGDQLAPERLAARWAWHLAERQDDEGRAAEQGPLRVRVPIDGDELAPERRLAARWARSALNSRRSSGSARRERSSRRPMIPTGVGQLADPAYLPRACRLRAPEVNYADGYTFDSWRRPSRFSMARGSY
jgi:hypothetical protein